MKLEPGMKLLCEFRSFDSLSAASPSSTFKTVYFQSILASGELLVSDEEGQLSYVWAKNCKIAPIDRKAYRRGPWR